MQDIRPEGEISGGAVRLSPASDLNCRLGLGHNTPHSCKEFFPPFVSVVVQLELLLYATRIEGLVDLSGADFRRKALLEPTQLSIRVSGHLPDHSRPELVYLPDLRRILRREVFPVRCINETSELILWCFELVGYIDIPTEYALLYLVSRKVFIINTEVTVFSPLYLPTLLVVACTCIKVKIVLDPPKDILVKTDDHKLIRCLNGRLIRERHDSLVKKVIELPLVLVRYLAALGLLADNSRRKLEVPDLLEELFNLSDVGPVVNDGLRRVLAQLLVRDLVIHDKRHRLPCVWISGKRELDVRNEVRVLRLLLATSHILILFRRSVKPLLERHRFRDGCRDDGHDATAVTDMVKRLLDMSRCGAPFLSDGRAHDDRIELVSVGGEPVELVGQDLLVLVGQQQFEGGLE